MLRWLEALRARMGRGYFGEMPLVYLLLTNHVALYSDGGLTGLNG